ncbi:conserved protein of unknown function [Bradyrhizobium vignae]|uniref:Uncharacterized protein n=1 Tax=Bradyrhizobium vignae TaxID=1549949 RepID=A0A2U3PWT7_9BRAD|nr:conserved protein of unknown function [Bradyrhizobium vignae]
MFCNNSLHPCYKRSFHNQPSVAFAAESERLGGTCASLLENVRINRCSRYLNAYGEGRVLTSHPRSAAQKAHAENRTAAYRWCRTHGLPCAMVGRLMPRSPGSRIRSGLPHSRESHRPSRRLTRLPHPQELDRSNDGQDHTVLPYAHSAARPHEASGSRRAIRPALDISRTTLPRPPQPGPRFERLANRPSFREPGCFGLCRISEFR